VEHAGPPSLTARESLDEARRHIAEARTAIDTVAEISDTAPRGLEAMAFGVPVIAYAAGALPETVGDAGILFTQKSYEDVAALVDAVVGDPGLRARLAAAGRERVAAFGPARFEARVRQVFGAWSGPAA